MEINAISLLKISFFTIVLSVSCNVYADYYIVYPAPAPYVTCAYRYVLHHSMMGENEAGSYRSSIYYLELVCSTAGCGCGQMPRQMNPCSDHADSWQYSDDENFYAPAPMWEDDTYDDETYNQDERTDDDVGGDMDIDY